MFHYCKEVINLVNLCIAALEKTDVIIQLSSHVMVSMQADQYYC